MSRGNDVTTRLEEFDAQVGSWLWSPRVASIVPNANLPP